MNGRIAFWNPPRQKQALHLDELLEAAVEHTPITIVYEKEDELMERIIQPIGSTVLMDFGIVRPTVLREMRSVYFEQIVLNRSRKRGRKLWIFRSSRFKNGCPKRKKQVKSQ